MNVSAICCNQKNLPLGRALAGARFQTDKVMVGIILIAGAGVALTELLRLIERRFERWRPSFRG